MDLHDAFLAYLLGNFSEIKKKNLRGFNLAQEQKSKIWYRFNLAILSNLCQLLQITSAPKFIQIRQYIYYWIYIGIFIYLLFMFIVKLGMYKNNTLKR